MKFYHLLLAAAVLTSCSGGQPRNIALHRAAYHSSAADYNYTAQLVTDGIIDTREPVGYEVLENGRRAAKHRKESVLDSRRAVHFKMQGQEGDISVVEHGIHQVADAMGINVAANFGNLESGPVEIDFLASCDGGSSWKQLHSIKTELKSRAETKFSFAFAPDDACTAYKMAFKGDNVQEWSILAWDFYSEGEPLRMLGNEFFRSLWLAEDCGPQWLKVDLGADSRLSGAVFHWVNGPASGRILVSKDGEKWRQAAAFGSAQDSAQASVKLRGRGRFVKVEMDPAGDGNPLALSELQIFGKNSLSLPESRWQLARASEADDPSAWIPAEVPGTVLSAFTDIGAVPDISYGNDQEYISDSYFNADFLYRGVLPFDGPEGRRVFLDFGGINWKADVSLNGTALGSIDGAFTRGNFEVTGLVRQGDNEVEVLIRRPAHPGAAKGSTLSRIPPNGGILGADNPTFHASIGWDWIPTVRGRNIGIWRPVTFRTCGDVTVSDPLVQTVLNLPDTTHAEVTLEAVLSNHCSEARKVLWKGEIGPAHFAEAVELAGGETRTVRKVLQMDNPRLWWPNTYGEPWLYDASVVVEQDGVMSDSLAFKAGLREFSYSTEGGRLTAWVNGRRVSGRGGNWGFSELNLRYTARDYDIAVGYHKQMNFNMIRNWVGQTADESFYEACDRHGIMVWQDFWLANPTDGPDPDDEALFMANADDYVRKIRRHPCMALYCGRNEGMPPASLDAALRSLTASLHPDILYISHSSRGLVSGEGPYRRLPSSEYFTLRGQDRMHSERGVTGLPNFESMVRFMPSVDLWPQNDMWGVHDWGLENAQRPGDYTGAVISRFGDPGSAQRFSELAQWVSYDAFRAVFEGRSSERRGLLLWMSHNAWPSLVWCPYDYYFDPHAGFFACKKACEALHIQYNALTGHIEVVNRCAGNLQGLCASASILDMYGRELNSFDFALDSAEDSTFEGPSVELPSGSVSFLRLALNGPGGTSGSGGVLSENFYVLGDPEDDFRALLDLPEASVKCNWTVQETDDAYLVRADLHNSSDVPAMMLRLNLLNNRPVNSGPAPSGLCTSEPQADDYRILPAEWTDNYFHLMPGESRNVRITVDKLHFDTALKPRVELSGFNL